MLLIATLLVLAVAATGYVLLEVDLPPQDAPDAPRRLPRPSARDLHTVAPGTLGRVRVPSWG